ncbi:TRAP transporter substrate-binding protein [Ammoniphilus resinae]|uniref:Tripartite ATP-independent transporter DctP family solute receptor n=1 Tax=Ammoniphilus resinae TaxID=861532 RepID=A0ABS4GVR9_9BACL|nr:TRAP transporter substrate-binding protein [Ammoniphilus resinae]MBP1934356.1 tripartite ATP-independent transporter DctP family solute receptor [Ammoniphilus resinae]
MKGCFYRSWLLFLCIAIGSMWIVSGCQTTPVGPADRETSEPAFPSSQTPVVKADAAEHLLLRIAFTQGKEGIMFQAAERYQRRVQEMSKGRIIIETLPDGQMGTENNQWEALQKGSIEMMIAHSILDQIAPEFLVFEIPFFFAGRAEVERFLNSRLWQVDFQEILGEKGLTGMGIWDSGFRQMTNQKKVIKKPEDLAGLSIRIPQNPYREALFQALQAKPTYIPFHDLRPYLQQRIVDGQESTLLTIEGERLADIQPFVSLTNHIYSPTLLLANQNWFAQLAAEDQQVLLKAAEQVGKEIREMVKEKEQQIIKQLKENGMVVSTVDRESFQDKALPVIDHLKRQMNPDFVDKVIQQIQVKEK